MSFGKMSLFIRIIEVRSVTDPEGFATKVNTTVATMRAYREGRHGSVRWSNLAVFSDATDMFRFRAVPGVTIAPGMLILTDTERFEITSVENVRSRGMYVEVLAKKVVAASDG